MGHGISLTGGGTIAAGPAVTYGVTVPIQAIDREYGSLPVLHYMGDREGVGYAGAGAVLPSYTFYSEVVSP